MLVDFGVARELGEEDDGTVGIGTPRFMAPEVFAGGTVSPRSDVFGLAATAWTLLVGQAAGLRRPDEAVGARARASRPSSRRRSRPGSR